MKRRDIVFLVLAGFFIANAVIGEMIGGKLIQIGPFMMSIGIIPWPVVFLSTDLINEYFGKKGVRTITLITAGLIVYTFIILFAGMSVNSASFSPVSSEQFNAVFGQSLWIIAGSLTAFLLSQLIDVGIFWIIRSRTGHRLIWLRATGSTVVSQLIDTFVVSGIAFYLPGKITRIRQCCLYRICFQVYDCFSRYPADLPGSCCRSPLPGRRRIGKTDLGSIKSYHRGKLILCILN